MSCVCRAGLTTTPTSGGVRERGAVQMAGITSVWARQRVVTSASGPPPSSRRASCGSRLRLMGFPPDYPTPSRPIIQTAKGNDVNIRKDPKEVDHHDHASAGRRPHPRAGELPCYLEDAGARTTPLVLGPDASSPSRDAPHRGDRRSRLHRRGRGGGAGGGG